MIPPETIAQIKERTDLVSLVGESVRLTREGRSWKGLCPFHKEKTPSFHVNPERGFYRCWGCKETGTALDFVMKLEGKSFVEAVRALADRAGIEVTDGATDAERREASAARRARDELYAANQLAATFFERCLRGGPGTTPHPLAHHALEELSRRGLDIAEDGAATDPVTHALQAFRIGYAPFGWDGLATFFRQQGISPLVAEKVGLLVPRSSGTGHYDRFRHRLMFAVTDVTGRVVAFSGRALADPSVEEVARHGLSGPRAQEDSSPAKYVNSPESPVYTKGEHVFGLYQARQSIRELTEAVLVEGNFDVVSLHARGIGHVVAPLGTSFTPPQARLLRRFAPRVVLLFDGDPAGRKATRAARGPCREAGLTPKVAVLPDGLDPDDLVRNQGPEALRRILQGARDLLEHLIEETLEGDGFTAASHAEQLARARAVATLLSEEQDPSLREMLKVYADQLASRLELFGSSPAGLRQLERVLEEGVRGKGDGPAPGTAPARTPVERPDRARSRSTSDGIHHAILGAILDFPDLLDDPEVEVALASVDGDTALAIAAARQTGIGEKGLYAAEFLAQIPAPIHSFASGRLASPVFDAKSDARVELLDNARKLRRLSLTRAHASGVEELRRPGAAGDPASEDELLREINRRVREKHGLG